MADEQKDQHGDGHGEELAKPHGRHSAGSRSHGDSHEEHGGVAEWLISFADNVALLMGFFVILLAMNMQKPKMGGLGGEGKNPGSNDDQFLELIYGVREAFNNLPSPDSKEPKDAPLLDYIQRKTRGETTNDGSPGLKPTQQAIRPADYNAPTGSFAFEPYSTTMDSAGRALAIDLAKRQRGQTYIIEVRGHASAIEASAGIAGAIKLSFDRAQVVANSLVENGLKWQNLRVVACGDNERITPIATDKAEHKTNQRVEIIVTNETLAPDPHVSEPR